MKTLSSTVMALIIQTTACAVGAQTQQQLQRIPGQVQASVQSDGSVRFYFTPDSSDLFVTIGKKQQLERNTEEFPSWIVDPSTFKGSKASAYKLIASGGKFAGYWFGDDTPESAFALQNAALPGWSIEKIGTFNPKQVTAKPVSIPLSREDVTASLQRELFAQAKEIACKAQVRPKEIKVAASLQATVGAVVVGGGSITFEVLWEVQKLCE